MCVCVIADGVGNESVVVAACLLQKKESYGLSYKLFALRLYDGCN